MLNEHLERTIKFEAGSYHWISNIMVSLLIYFGWIRLPLHSFICILFLILGTACSISETPRSYPIFFFFFCVCSFELCSRLLYSISSYAHVSKFQVDELFGFLYSCISIVFPKHQMIFLELKYFVTLWREYALKRSPFLFISVEISCKNGFVSSKYFVVVLMFYTFPLHS